MKLFATTAIILALSLGGIAAADSITVDGQTYDDVLIVETSNMYYIKMPQTGSVMTVRRTDVDPAAVVITTDREKALELEAAWDASRSDREARQSKDQFAGLPEDFEMPVPTIGASAPEDEAPADPEALIAELEANPQKALQDLKAVQSQLPPAFQAVDLNNIQNLNLQSPEVQQLMVAVMQDVPGTKRAIVSALSNHYGFTEDQTRQILNQVLEENGWMQYAQGGF